MKIILNNMEFIDLKVISGLFVKDVIFLETFGRILLRIYKIDIDAKSAAKAHLF